MMNPVHLDASLDAKLSRWLWLAKMFLAVPHYVILAGLTAALIVTTAISAVAILVTGSYPRPLFDFAVGVLRWHWRVGFYVYAALGTDTYPPFTLRRADYPAELEIEYPAQLSRGRVLVKWLLAVPHIAILALLLGVIMLYPWDVAANWQTGHPVGGYSVLNLLVVIAGFFLLITGRYPAPLFGLLLGISRWTYRVIAYVGLLTDAYPPFRLDDEPGHRSSVSSSSSVGSVR